MRKQKTTKELLRSIPSEYSDAFYSNLENFTLDELFDFVAEIMPVDRAERILKEVTEHWEEDEIGIPYKKLKNSKNK